MLIPIENTGDAPIHLTIKAKEKEKAHTVVTFTPGVTPVKKDTWEALLAEQGNAPFLRDRSADGPIRVAKDAGKAAQAR